MICFGWYLFGSFCLNHHWFFGGEKSISKIASALGKPVMMDECTAKKLRVSFARVLVDIDTTQELKQHMVIKDHTGARIQQKVEYEWQPLFYKGCNKVGHDCSLKQKQRAPSKPTQKKANQKH